MNIDKFTIDLIEIFQLKTIKNKKNEFDSNDSKIKKTIEKKIIAIKNTIKMMKFHVTIKNFIVFSIIQKINKFRLKTNQHRMTILHAIIKNLTNQKQIINSKIRFF